MFKDFSLCVCVHDIYILVYECDIYSYCGRACIGLRMRCIFCMLKGLESLDCLLYVCFFIHVEDLFALSVYVFTIQSFTSEE